MDTPATVPRVFVDRLDYFGRWLLDLFEPRYVGLLIFAFLLLFALIRRLLVKQWPSTEQLCRGAASLVFVLSGLVVFVIFLLTKPPALDALSGESLAWIGLLTGIFTCGIGFREIRSIFFQKRD